MTDNGNEMAAADDRSLDTNPGLVAALERGGKRPATVARAAADRIREMGADLVALQLFAKRYADGRSSYAPGWVNEVTRRMIGWGLEPNPGGEGVVWCKDGDGFNNPDADHFAPGTDTARGSALGLPRGCRLDRALLAELGLPDDAGLESALAAVRRLKGAV